MFKHIGGYLNTAEVLRILQQYGPIERSWPASETEREMFQLPEGLFVRFTYYDDCRDAKQVWLSGRHILIDCVDRDLL